jgi:hypothetical protein
MGPLWLSSRNVDSISAVFSSTGGRSARLHERMPTVNSTSKGHQALSDVGAVPRCDALVADSALPGPGPGGRRACPFAGLQAGVRRGSPVPEPLSGSAPPRFDRAHHRVDLAAARRDPAGPTPRASNTRSARAYLAYGRMLETPELDTGSPMGTQGAPLENR